MTINESIFNINEVLIENLVLRLVLDLKEKNCVLHRCYVLDSSVVRATARKAGDVDSSPGPG